MSDLGYPPTNPASAAGASRADQPTYPLSSAGASRSGVPPSEVDDDDDERPRSGAGRERRKIEIKFIQDKARRHITFSKRKHGIMKKAWELSVLTGTQVLLLVVSETGLVYTFTTPKLQPLVTQSEGKTLIQSCLNAPDNPTSSPQSQSNHRDSQGSSRGGESPQHGTVPPVAGPAPLVAPGVHPQGAYVAGAPPQMDPLMGMPANDDGTAAHLVGGDTYLPAEYPHYMPVGQRPQQYN